MLYTFKGGSDGSEPYAGLLMDKTGNLYGTTFAGGAHGYGTVFKLAKGGSETILYSFGGGNDGAYPEAGVILDASGNLYGTTADGGSLDGCQGEGCGTIFKVAPDGTESVVHAFAGGKDGSTPTAGLVADRSGNLYGTTYSGGSTANCDYQTGCGTVYKLAPDGTETVLYAFHGGSDGGNPFAGLIIDAAGNLYGTTQYAGSGNCVSGCGVVFRVAPDGSETVLHAFDYSDGAYPAGGVVMDKAGNLYGTTGWGYVVGNVYRLSPDGTLTVLHSFTDVPDGANPYDRLAMDGSGNLYGTTQAGGKRCGNYGSSCGVIFEIAPGGTETVLHAFRKKKGDGILPLAGLIRDRKGNLYGTTTALTWHSATGTIFKLTP